MEEDMKRIEANGAISEIRDEVSIQIENSDSTLTTFIRQKLKTMSPLTSRCCIHRVSKTLRCVNEAAYTPQVISIGPLHRDNKDLKVMEEHKWRYLYAFLDRYSQIELEDNVKALKGLEESARQCYAEPCELSSDRFVEMMLLDGFFILVLFLKLWIVEWQDNNDPIFYTRWMLSVIIPDMLLLENQIPFFILERLFELSKVGNQNDGCPCLLKLTQYSFSSVITMPSTIQIPDTVSSSQVKHLLDFVRSCLLPRLPSPTIQDTNSSSQVKRLLDFVRSCLSSLINMLVHHRLRNYRRCNVTYSATELHEAGVKFKVVKSESLFDIRFKNGVLEIPLLQIEDQTEIFFRNLIAWEQCQSSLTCDILSYTRFMDNLINTPKDVGLLIRYGIIENKLGDNEDVSRLFNNIWKEVVSDSFYFSGLCKDLNDYYKKPWQVDGILKVQLFQHSMGNHIV